MSKSLAHLLIAALALLGLLLLTGRGEQAQSQIVRPVEASSTVRFLPPPGVYDETIMVRIETDSATDRIYFTTDGSRPTPGESALYEGPLYLSPRPPGVVALRAVAVAEDGTVSVPVAASYVLGLDTAVPVLSLIVDPMDLWRSEDGLFVHPTMTGRDWERPANIAFFEADGGSGFAAPLGVRVHGGRSRLDEKKSLRLYFRDDYGLPNIEFPLFPDTDKAVFKRLVLHNGGQDYPAVSVNATLLRNHLTGELAREVGGFASHTRPVLLYLNGSLWGIYNLRERIDDRYLAEKMQIEDPDLLVGFENDLEASYGDLEHWENLQRFLSANDLSDPANYAYMQTQINVANFIDYNLFQIITANADWPHSNQLKFRERAGGQWHWMFWDSDYAFGLMPDSYIEKDMFERVLEHDDEDQRQAALLLDKLLQNPQFRNRFLVRLSDLLNTVFLPQKVEEQVTALADGLAQDIIFETVRWPGSGDWEAGVDYMREFARRRPDIVRQQAAAQFDLPGTAVVSINPPVQGEGDILLNQQIHLPSAELPWSGTYFLDSVIQLQALPAPGYTFVGWEGLPAEQQSVEIEVAVNKDIRLRPNFRPAGTSDP